MAGSSLKPPPKKALRAFHIGQVGDDTVELYLQKGWSLAICCKACERLVEWTPPELARRYSDRTALRIAALVDRLACGGEAGCRSREIAVFPHPYDGPWTWTPPA
jgi:hypothetical protein